MDHTVDSTKAASEVAMLALYSEDCAKHDFVHVRAGPRLTEAVIGDEKSLMFLQALVSICSQVLLFSLMVSVWLLVCGTCPKLCQS